MTLPPRHNADEILRAVAQGGRIKIETAQKLLELVTKKTEYQAHLEVAIATPMMLSTIDNEEDALETISRLERKPDRPDADVKREA